MFVGMLAALAAAAEPTLPKVQVEVPAVYPVEAREEGRSGSVLLEVAVDADGHVIDAGVLEATAPEFEIPALQAVFGYQFSPALDEEGRPSEAVVQLRIAFSLDAMPVLAVEGQVVDASGVPIFGAELRLEGPDQAQRVLRILEDGRFQIADLAPGVWKLRASAEGFKTEEAVLEVSEWRVLEVSLALTQVSEPSSEEVIVVEGRRRPVEISERVLSSEEIRYLPGTNGDVVRVVQNLPGVARPPLNIGQLIIRGTAPEDSAYYLDGVRIPLVFHFAGLSTVVNGDSIEEVGFQPGNYSVRYGNTQGGLVDLRTSTVLPEKSRGYVSVDLFQATGFVDQKIGKKAAISASFRRSYIDAVLNPILNKGGGGSFRAPRYYDAQLRYLQKLPNGTFDAMFLLSDDRFRILGEEEDGEQSVAIGLGTSFQKLRLQYRSKLGDWRQETSLIVGPESQDFQFGGDGEAYDKRFAVDVRHEWSTAPKGEAPGWRVGLDLRANRFEYKYDISGFGEPEGGDLCTVAPGLYVEPTFQWGRLTFTPGLRLDPLISESGATWMAVDPRAAITVKATDSTKVRLTAGRYSQFPQVREILDSQGEIANKWAMQASVGLEQELGSAFSLEVNAFYTALEDQIVGREDAFRFFSGPPPVGPFDIEPYANDGRGRIGGVEGLFKANTDKLTSWVAATWSRSLRTKRPDQEEVLFENDQPLVVTAIASYELPRRWRLGGRARLTSGIPYTPVVNKVYDLDAREFFPVYGERDSERLPWFWSLDVRVDKEWQFKNWSFAIYLDLQNATNTRNVEVVGWTYDYGAADPVRSLPILPAFGLRGEW